MVPYLSKLCAALATSMVGDNGSVTIKVIQAHAGLVPGDDDRSLTARRCVEAGERIARPSTRSPRRRGRGRVGRIKAKRFRGREIQWQTGLIGCSTGR